MRERCATRRWLRRSWFSVCRLGWRVGNVRMRHHRGRRPRVTRHRRRGSRRDSNLGSSTDSSCGRRRKVSIGRRRRKGGINTGRRLNIKGGRREILFSGPRRGIRQIVAGSARRTQAPERLHGDILKTG